MTQNEPAAIENAEAIIELFGGIRPMASKINVPVTTVQGWKKRNVIPGARRADILQAAQQLGVDLSDVMSASSARIANENAQGASFTRMVETGPLCAESPRMEQKSADRAASFEIPNLEKQLARTERRAVTKSTIVNLFLLALMAGSAVLLLLPENERRFDAIEGDVAALKTKQESFLGKLLPDELENRVAALKNEIGAVQTGISSAIEKARSVSAELQSGDPGAQLEQRVQNLEAHIGDITSMPVSGTIAALMTRYEELSQSLGGQEQLKASAAQLLALLANAPAEDPAQVDQALQAAPQDPQLSQTFQGVPPQDIKAAAMLLGMTQFRSSLNRDNQPFSDDLALLKKLVGPNDPELLASIERLAPYAEQGVLTPGGLTNEFKGIAGDVVVASLQGEDVSIQDKAKARLGDMFQVEKNGEPVGGTPTQNTLAKTDKLLTSGDLEGAIAQMQGLDGPAAIAAQPWISKAQATLSAQKLKSMLTGAVTTLTGQGGSIYSTSGPMPIRAQVPRERGLNIPANEQLLQQQAAPPVAVPQTAPQAAPGAPAAAEPPAASSTPVEAPAAPY